MSSKNSHRDSGKAVLEVHASLLSQQDLSQKLASRCNGRTVKVQVRHNLYTIYLDSAADRDKLQADLVSAYLTTMAATDGVNGHHQVGFNTHGD